MTITWNTGLAAERARHNLKLNKKRRPAVKAASFKRQAASDKRQAHPWRGWDKSFLQKSP